MLISIAAAAFSLTGPTAAHAAPVIPDNFPNLVNPQENFQPSQEAETPTVSVTFEDGTPAEGATVHRGDVLIVHGRGFNPSANRGGYPLPIPPGVPNGVYAFYSGLPDYWKPSEQAPSESRTHPHDRMAWVTPPGTLEAVPSQGVNMQRTIARSAQPMDENGNFDARIVVDPPKETPGHNFGVYIYAAAGSVNAAEEFYVPIPFSPEPGDNAPLPTSPDLKFEVSELAEFFSALGGSITGKNGAEVVNDTASFSYDGTETTADGTTIARYRGEINMTARFNLVHITVRNPQLETNGEKSVITAEVSKRYDVGPDEVVRVPIASVYGAEAQSSGSAESDGPVNLHTTLGTVQRNN